MSQKETSIPDKKRPLDLHKHTYNLTVIACNKIQHFNNGMKGSLGEALVSHLILCLRLISQGKSEPRLDQRAPLINNLVNHAEELVIFIRLCWDVKQINNDAYGTMSTMAAEIVAAAKAWRAATERGKMC